MELDKSSYNVWSEKTTHVPIRLESERKLILRDNSGAERQQAIKKVWSDFVFNGKLDEALFGLTPPNDYEVETQKANNGRDAILAEQKKAVADLKRAREHAGKKKE